MAVKKKKSSNTLMPSSPPIWAGVEDKKWRTEEDHRTMTRAGEIKADRDRMKGVKDHQKKMSKNLEKVCK